MKQTNSSETQADLLTEKKLSDSELEKGENLKNGRKELSTKNQSFKRSLTQYGDHSSSSSSDEEFTTVLTKKPLSNSSNRKKLPNSSKGESHNEMLSQHKEYESESAQALFASQQNTGDVEETLNRLEAQVSKLEEENYFKEVRINELIAENEELRRGAADRKDETSIVEKDSNFLLEFKTNIDVMKTVKQFFCRQLAH